MPPKVNASFSREPLPSPGPPKYTERLALLLERRPAWTGPTRQKLRRAIVRRSGGLAGIKDKIRKRYVRRDLKAFVKEGWEHLEPGTELVWSWHLDVICDQLMRVTAGEITRLLINVPPGHMKSKLVCVFWPAWEWLNNPAVRSLYASYHQKLSTRDSRYCRDLLNSEWYQALIPKVYGPHWDKPWEMKGDKNAVEAYATELAGERQATSVGGAGAGFRAHKVVIDDPMNVNEFPTLEALEKVISWYNVRISSRMNDMATGAIVIIMQRLHENDLAGYVLEVDRLQKDNPDWVPFEHICLRTEYDPDRPNKHDSRTTRGELLFPLKFPAKVIAEAKIKLGNQYAAQHDQDPMPQSGGIFAMCKLKFWYPPDTFPIPIAHKEKNEKNEYVMCEQGPAPLAYHEQAQSWDMAFKDKKDNDYVAGQLWGRYMNRAYLIDQEYGHMTFTQTVQALVRMTNNYPLAFAKWVEDKANGTAVLDVLKDKIMGLLEVDPKGGKIARAQAVSPFVGAGNVWLPHPDVYPWVHLLLAEMRAFPVAKHDDQVDAMSQALVRMMIGGAAFWSGITND